VIWNRNDRFEVPDQILVGFGTVSTGKRRLSAGECCLHPQNNAVEENGILFTKSCKLCLIFQNITTGFPIP